MACDGMSFDSFWAAGRGDDRRGADLPGAGRSSRSEPAGVRDRGRRSDPGGGGVGREVTASSWTSRRRGTQSQPAASESLAPCR